MLLLYNAQGLDSEPFSPAERDVLNHRLTAEHGHSPHRPRMRLPLAPRQPTAADRPVPSADAGCTRGGAGPVDVSRSLPI